MRITNILCRRNRLPNGHIFRGKDRLVKKVEPVHLRRLEQDFAIEEQNMFYLRHPYLSEVESNGHGKALERNKIRLEKFQDEARRMFKEDLTIYDQLKHLRVQETWD